MKISYVLRSIAALGLFAIALPSLAAAYQSDGALPMYPHGKLDAKETSLTPAAIARGVPLVLMTDDSVPTVDTWYGSNLPKRCNRQGASGAIKYACPGGSVMIYAHAGQTQVALIPPLPGM